MNGICVPSEVPDGSHGKVAVASASSFFQDSNLLPSELSSELACRVEGFLAANTVDAMSARALRSASPHVQIAVLKRGSLRWARNPSASLMWQLRKFASNDGALMKTLGQGQQTGSTAAAVPSGFNPTVIPVFPMTPKPVGGAGSFASATPHHVGPVPMEVQHILQQPSPAKTSATPASSTILGAADLAVPCTSAIAQGYVGVAINGYQSPSLRMTHSGTDAHLSPSTSPCVALTAAEAGYSEVVQPQRARAASHCVANTPGGAHLNAGELWFAVEEFLLANLRVDAMAATALRASPPSVQKAVLAGGSLGWASNCSAALMSRLREYSGTTRSTTLDVQWPPHRKLICGREKTRVHPRRNRIGPKKRTAEFVSGRARRRVVCVPKEDKDKDKDERRQKQEESKREEEEKRKQIKLKKIEENRPGCAPRYTVEQAKRLGKRRYSYTARQAAQFRSIIRADKELWEAMLVFEPVDLVWVHARLHGSHEPLVGIADFRAVGDFLKDEGFIFVDSRSQEAWKRWRNRFSHQQDGTTPGQDTKSQHEDGESEVAESPSDDGDANLLPVLPTISDSDDGASSAQIGRGSSNNAACFERN